MNHRALGTFARSATHCLLLTALVTTAAWCGDALALITVGPASDAACDFHDIRSAVEHAAQTPGADVVAVTSGSWLAQTVVGINDTDDLTIEGGFANCSAGISTGRSVLDGWGVSPREWLFTHYGDHHLSLINLDLVRGLGGVYSLGNGRLTLSNVQLLNNYAVYGGGLYASGLGGTQKIVELYGVVFSGNSARASGGGLYAHLADITIASGTIDNYFVDNSALGMDVDSGDGGAIYLSDSNLHVTAHATPGFNPIGFMSHNTAARYGGGIFAEASSAAAYALYFANDDASGVLRFNENSAIEGGLMYLQTAATAGAGAEIHADFVNTRMFQNSATDGVIYANPGAAQTIVGIHLQQSLPTDTAPRCVTGMECNSFDANHASNGNVISLAASATSGRPYIQLDHAFVRQNTAAYDLLFTDFGEVQIDSSLIAANTVSSRLIASYSGDVRVATSTIAGNTFLAGEASVEIFNAPGTLTLLRDLFVDAHTVCTVGSGISVGARDLGVGTGSGSGCLPTDPGANIQFLPDPFVDAAAGDFHLLRTSSAVDRWAANDLANPPPAFDLDGIARPQAIAAHTTTPYDFGAYEARAEVIFIDGFDGP